jgi:adenylate cyclase class 2
MQEIEAKFIVQDLPRIKTQLEKLDAQLIQERVLESNMRFDLPGATLLAQGRVLRLRRDTDVRLTYKSASTNEQGVLSREEIEFIVEDYERARRFLEALGYEKLVYYEKYRTTYDWNNSHIMLDELPFGDFVEIEGETLESIRQVADQFSLNWETAIATSYSALFERVQRALKLSFQDLSFENFKNIRVKASDLGVLIADA